MALGLLFGSVLGFASTVLVSLALSSESLSQPSVGISTPVRSAKAIDVLQLRDVHT
jgi:hypothetical protein